MTPVTERLCSNITGLRNLLSFLLLQPILLCSSVLVPSSLLFGNLLLLSKYKNDFLKEFNLSFVKKTPSAFAWFRQLSTDRNCSSVEKNQVIKKCNDSLFRNKTRYFPNLRRKKKCKILSLLATLFKSLPNLLYMTKKKCSRVRNFLLGDDYKWNGKLALLFDFTPEKWQKMNDDWLKSISFFLFCHDRLKTRIFGKKSENRLEKEKSKTVLPQISHFALSQFSGHFNCNKRIFFFLHFLSAFTIVADQIEKSSIKKVFVRIIVALRAFLLRK